jgi:hypothetical protein
MSVYPPLLNAQFPCPCCGYFVFKRPPGSLERCPICGWIDDANQLVDPHLSQGANNVSLWSAQSNYITYKACEPHIQMQVRAPYPHEIKDRLFRPIDFKLDKFAPIVNNQWPPDPNQLYYWRPEYYLRLQPIASPFYVHNPGTNIGNPVNQESYVFLPANSAIAGQKASLPMTKRLAIWEIISVEMAAFMVGFIAAVIFGLQALYHQSNQPLIQPLINNHTGLDILLQSFVTILELYPIVIVYYVLIRSNESFKVIGLTSKITPTSIGLAFLLLIGVFAINFLLSEFVIVSHLHSPVDTTTSSGINHAYEIIGILTSFRTAVVEEVCVCGYLMYRLLQMGVSLPVAVTISVIIRCSYHLYGGWELVLLNIPFGIMQALVFVHFRDIKPMIAAHFLYDSIVFSVSIFHG